MGGGNAQKSAMARQKNQEKAAGDITLSLEHAFPRLHFHHLFSCDPALIRFILKPAAGTAVVPAA
jgi:hypothetical protein